MLSSHCYSPRVQQSCWTVTVPVPPNSQGLDICVLGVEGMSDIVWCALNILLHHKWNKARLCLVSLPVFCVSG
jgi:hypothetical protein